jgi:peptidoglycan/LPS O-acetylase OafA/YrhL
LNQINPQSSSSSGYRADIDGLRAIAVLIVIGFHLFPGWFPGGFVGVDVFFVISGFLIGGILIRDAKAGGISILEFYCRRDVRILPAFLLVLAATWLMGWALFFADEYEALGKDIVASSLFVSNLRTWSITGYFAPEAETQPLLHLWSLGIEEQFYLVVPLLIGFLSHRGSHLLWWIILLTVGSLGLGWYASIHHPSAAFYWPITRAWELLAGVALSAFASANALTQRSLSVRWLNILGITGTLLLGLALLQIRPVSGYPGLWALLPVLGSVLIIGSGPGSLINRNLLCSQPLRYIGLISYPWYLWHWPIWIACKVAQPDVPDNWDRAAVVVVSFVLAALTMWLVEKPIRYSIKPLRRRACTLLGGLVLLMLLGGLSALRFPSERLGTSSAFVNAQEAATEKFLYPFKDNFGRTSNFTLDATESIEQSDPVVLFAGDSHMQHYWPRIQRATELLGSERMKWRIVTAGGHPMLPAVNRTDEGYACDQFFEFILAEAKRPEVKRVVLSSAWQVYFLGPFPPNRDQNAEISALYSVGGPAKKRIEIKELDPVLAGLEKSIRELKLMGKEVIVILPSPSSYRWDPRKLVRWHSGSLKTSDRMRVDRSNYETFIAPLKTKIATAVLRGGGNLIDPCDYIEEGGHLLGLEPDGSFRYKDHHHFREFYVLKEAMFVDDFLKNGSYVQP